MFHSASLIKIVSSCVVVSMLAVIIKSLKVLNELSGHSSLNSFETCFGDHLPSTYSLQASRTSQYCFDSRVEIWSLATCDMERFPFDGPRCASLNSGKKRNSLLFQTTGIRCTPL